MSKGITSFEIRCLQNISKNERSNKSGLKELDVNDSRFPSFFRTRKVCRENSVRRGGGRREHELEISLTL